MVAAFIHDTDKDTKPDEYLDKMLALAARDFDNVKIVSRGETKAEGATFVTRTVTFTLKDYAVPMKALYAAASRGDEKFGFYARGPLEDYARVQKAVKAMLGSVRLEPRE
jgi:hypothetical protein